MGGLLQVWGSICHFWSYFLQLRCWKYRTMRIMKMGNVNYIFHANHRGKFHPLYLFPVQITGLSFSSVDQSFIYVQGVDYEVCIWLVSLDLYLIQIELLVSSTLLLITCLVEGRSVGSMPNLIGLYQETPWWSVVSFMLISQFSIVSSRLWCTDVIYNCIAWILAGDCKLVAWGI